MTELSRLRQSDAAGYGPTSVTTGDFNGDGLTELATANIADDVSVLLNQCSAVVILGDANDNGVFNNKGIASFVLALTNPVAYQAMFPDVDPDVVLDMNGDEVFDNLDIAGFVAALTGP